MKPNSCKNLKIFKYYNYSQFYSTKPDTNNKIHMKLNISYDNKMNEIVSTTNFLANKLINWRTL